MSRIIKTMLKATGLTIASLAIAGIGLVLWHHYKNSQPVPPLPSELQAKIKALPHPTFKELVRIPRSEESVPPNEPDVIRRVMEHAADAYIKEEAKHLQAAPAEALKRDAHPDSLGTFFGVLTVPDGLPEELRVGTFAKPGSHLILVRASTGLFEGAWQQVPNAHAFAMKIFDVDAPNNFPGANVHDVIETDYPVFLFPDPAAYDLMNHVGPVKYLAPSWNPLNWNWKEIELTRRTLHWIGGVAETEYHSQLPYAWGEADVKYVLRPIDSPDVQANYFSPHYLTEKLAEQLRRGSIQMQLNIQFRQPGEKIEDGTDEWKGEARPVATIFIPQQDIEGPDYAWLGENISMNPGRAPIVQKPVGGEGFLRSQLYQQQSNLRAIFNGVERDANGMPSGWQSRFADLLTELKEEIEDLCNE